MTQTDARFRDEAAIREYLQEIRWPKGPVCPRCRTVNRAYVLAKKPGLYRCGRVGWRKDFNVKSRTIFEGSHIPLNKWLLATHLILSHGERISPRQLGQILGFGNYWVAWRLARRIREALQPMPNRRRVLTETAILCLLNTPPKHTTRKRASSKKKERPKRPKSGLSTRVRAVALTLLAGALAAVCACAPFQSVPGDVCNDPTQNYEPEFAYECNHR